MIKLVLAPSKEEYDYYLRTNMINPEYAIWANSVQRIRGLDPKNIEVCKTDRWYLVKQEIIDFVEAYTGKKIGLHAERHILVLKVTHELFTQLDLSESAGFEIDPRLIEEEHFQPIIDQLKILKDL